MGNWKPRKEYLPMQENLEEFARQTGGTIVALTHATGQQGVLFELADGNEVVALPGDFVTFKKDGTVLGVGRENHG